MNTFQRLLRGLSPRIRWLPLTAGTLVLLSGLAQSNAQPPGARQSSAVQGTVERMTSAPRGEIDGAVLSEGTWLHWPPHMQDRFANVVREGDRVRATGRTETGPAGDTHFEVEAVTNLRTNVVADNPDYAFGPPPPPQFRGRGRRGPPPPPFGAGRLAASRNQAATTDVEGSVTRFTSAPRGEIDGAVLDNGIWLHWPPHRQDRFANAFKEGDGVRASGRTETGPAGDAHFEIQSVTNTRTNATAENPDYAIGPPPPRGPRGRGKRVAPPPPPAVDRRPAAMTDSNDVVEIRGTVQRMTTAPRGEIDGAILDDGTWVHWPPHMQDRFAGIIKAGDRVRATGQTETGPAGDTHFEVQSVTNLRTNSTAENPDLIRGPGAPVERRGAADTVDRERRLRDLQEQIDRLQREIERLRNPR